MKAKMKEGIKTGSGEVHCPFEFPFFFFLDLNVNWEVVSQWTVLHSAAVCGYFEIVKILLAHPQINVNVQNRSGYPPFSF